ncbi:MAG: protein-tyrosine phosphatase [Elusimicrobia bacterium]|nr:MAG: protein-tyrosine phosphatase [Elusimicrobiota bacterium]
MCRSPAAEKLLAHYGAGKGFEARSRGTAAQPYSAMTEAVAGFLAAEGVKNLAHKPALVRDEDIDWADLVVVMEEAHLEALAGHFPQSIRKTRKIMEFLGGDGDLRDPMGGDGKLYAEVMGKIKRAVLALIEGK